MRAILFALALLLAAGCTTPKPPLTLAPPRPHVTGSIEFPPPIASKFVPARRVEVWLPPDYFNPEAQRRSYPVIYMHDGQNVFDPATSAYGMEWGMDETMTRLIAEKKIRPAIVVAVWNTTNRLAEYMPPLPSATASRNLHYQAARQHPLGEAYVRYLVTELKPAIDARYRTLPGRNDTFIMGSSMGGLISLYAVCAYPRVFGGAACLSTAWPAAGDGFIASLQNRLPPPQRHQIYFDYGTETLDASYGPFQKRMDSLMEKAGYTAGQNWITKEFPGDDHSERSWSRRVHIPLEFLLGTGNP
jgi:predicted alpha/beta superfamily hydrolase